MSQSEFLTRQRWHELETWLAEGPSEWPAEWETEELDELLAGISEDNLHKEIDFGPPVGVEVWNKKREPLCVTYRFSPKGGEALWCVALVITAELSDNN